MADEPNKQEQEALEVEAGGGEPDGEGRAGGKAALLKDLADERALRHAAQQEAEALKARVAAIEGDATYQAAETLFLAGVPEDKVLELAESYLTGTKAEKKEIAAEQPPEVMAILKKADERAANAERVAQAAMGAVRERNLKEDAIRFCEDYDVEPNGDVGKEIAAMARKISAVSGNDINYAMLSDLAKFRGMKPTNDTQSQTEARRGKGGYEGPPPLERGSSAPSQGEPEAPVKIDPKRDVVSQLHDAAFKRFADKHGGRR